MWSGYKHVGEKKSLCRNEFGRTASGDPAKRLADGRCPLRTAGLDRPDEGLVPPRKADVVEPFEQAPAAEVVEREGPDPVSRTDFPGLQIDRDRQRGRRLDGVPQRFHSRAVDFDRQLAVLEGVAPEDVPESGGEDG